MSHLENLLCRQLDMADLDHGLMCEYRFDPVRKWRFDLAWPHRMIAAEVEGGTWSGGRHTRGAGFENDCEKYNQATRQGWRVFRFTGAMIEDGRAFALLQDVLSTA